MEELTALALAAGAGDRVALASFVRRTQADVWRFCAHLNGRAEADDLTQETYLRAIPALARFEARSSARSWLLSIARRTCADSVRRTVRRRRLLEQTSFAAAANPPRPRAQRSISPWCWPDWTLIGEWPSSSRNCWVCPTPRTAEICACPIGTIRSRVARAREDLVHELDQAEFGLSGRGNYRGRTNDWYDDGCVEVKARWFAGAAGVAAILATALCGASPAWAQCRTGDHRPFAGCTAGRGAIRDRSHLQRAGAGIVRPRFGCSTVSAKRSRSPPCTPPTRP